MGVRQGVWNRVLQRPQTPHPVCCLGGGAGELRYQTPCPAPREPSHFSTRFDASELVTTLCVTEVRWHRFGHDYEAAFPRNK